MKYLYAPSPVKLILKTIKQRVGAGTPIQTLARILVLEPQPLILKES